MLVFENAATHGFGTIPKLVMLDPQLTPQAKAIYAYFASFAGAGTTAFPCRSTIMRELRIGSVETYYQHFNQLIEQSYLSVEQKRRMGGLITASIISMRRYCGRPCPKKRCPKNRYPENRNTKISDKQI